MFPVKDQRLNFCIKGYSIIDLNDFNIKERYQTMFPDCTTNLNITLDKQIHTEEFGLKSNFFSTSCTRPLNLYMGQPLKLIVVHFNSFGFHLLTGEKMSQFIDGLPLFGEVFKLSEVECLYDRLFHASDNSTVVNVLESFFVQQLTHDYNPRILTAISSIKADPNQSLDILAHRLNISGRGLRKLFAQYIGVSPKYFARIKRLNIAISHIRQNPEKSLTEICYESGYFDQAHFIRDFREFALISPGDFKREFC